jgi:hypothetical protein
VRVGAVECQLDCFAEEGDSTAILEHALAEKKDSADHHREKNHGGQMLAENVRAEDQARVD